MRPSLRHATFLYQIRLPEQSPSQQQRIFELSQFYYNEMTLKRRMVQQCACRHVTRHVTSAELLLAEQVSPISSALVQDRIAVTAFS